MRYFFQRDMSELSGLSLVVGLAICHALETSLILKDKIYVKWPNDIVVAAQKIAGVLIEAQAEANGYCRVVMGMGINVNMQHAAQDEINQAWQALQNLTGSYIDRNILVINLINTLIDYLERFSQEGLKSFITQWERKDILFGHPVQLRPISKEYQGIGAGINAQGHLLLKNEHGIHAFSCGDTSLLKESK
jgi:BirA family biotin operon repressor/biotin-[acetyl-CoA-carboxylase] ligase